MQENLKKFQGKAFKYCGQIYTVQETRIVNQKAVIKTDLKSFVKLPSELNAFMDDIEFLKVDTDSIVKAFDRSVGIVHRKEDWTPAERIPAVPTPIQVEIVVAESNAAKVSNKLMDMFEKLSSAPTKETYEQATAMVNMANSIMNVQMTQIKLLSFKK